MRVVQTQAHRQTYTQTCTCLAYRHKMATAAAAFDGTGVKTPSEARALVFRKLSATGDEIILFNALQEIIRVCLTQQGCTIKGPLRHVTRDHHQAQHSGMLKGLNHPTRGCAKL